MTVRPLTIVLIRIRKVLSLTLSLFSKATEVVFNPSLNREGLLK